MMSSIKRLPTGNEGPGNPENENLFVISNSPVLTSANLSVNKEAFHKLLQNPGHITPEHLQSLEELVRLFPFCSLAHTLIAKSHYDQATMLASQKLRKAAAYAANRDRLKRVITSGWEERAVLDSPLADRPVSFEQGSEGSASVAEEVFSPASPAEDTIAGAIPEAVPPPPPGNEAEEGLEKPLEIETPADLLFDRLVVPLGQTHLAPQDPDGDEEPEEPPLQLGHLNEDDFAVEEFSRRSKKHVQNEIIESFIRTEPRITSQSLAQRDTYPSRDLAEKSTKPVRIVSENMANIYIRQRKYDKAIQLFEQLILKYPEKKEIFVKRIEELKQL